MLVTCLQWNAGDRCMAMWSKDCKLYKARIIEADEQKKVVKVKYEDYNEEEDRPREAICPMYTHQTKAHRLSSGERYLQSRPKRDKPEGQWPVFICTAHFAIEVTTR